MSAAWWQVVVSGSALVAAICAAVAAWRTYRASYRPILRPVPLWDHRVQQPDWQNNSLVLKNIGRGSAISVVVARLPTRGNETLFGEVDVVEPLGGLHGPNFVESRRVGRVEVPQTGPAALERGREYTIYYQDVSGGWHCTTFDVQGDGKFLTRIRGPVDEPQVPDWVRDRAQVVGGDPLGVP